LIPNEFNHCDFEQINVFDKEERIKVLRAIYIYFLALELASFHNIENRSKLMKYNKQHFIALNLYTKCLGYEREKGRRTNVDDENYSNRTYS